MKMLERSCEWRTKSAVFCIYFVQISLFSISLSLCRPLNPSFLSFFSFFLFFLFFLSFFSFFLWNKIERKLNEFRSRLFNLDFYSSFFPNTLLYSPILLLCRRFLILALRTEWKSGNKVRISLKTAQILAKTVKKHQILSKSVKTQEKSCEWRTKGALFCISFLRKCALRDEVVIQCRLKGKLKA